MGSLVVGWVIASEICHRRSAVSPSTAAREGAFSLQEEKYLPVTPRNPGAVATWRVVLAPFSGEARNGAPMATSLPKKPGWSRPNPLATAPGWRALAVIPASGEAPGELAGEEDVGQLRLPVGLPHPVAALALQILEVHRAALVGHGRDVHHPRLGRLTEERQQLEGELEVGEVVEGERHLHPVGREPALGEDRAGVVDEQVEPPGPVPDRAGEAADLVAGGQVGDEDLGEAPVASRISRAAASPLPGSRATIRVRAPIRANSLAVTRPIPFVAPVTSATRPSSMESMPPAGRPPGAAATGRAGA